jgi:citrate (Re)-synthase
VKRINDWVAEQYAHGRTTSISEAELIAQAKHRIPSLFRSEFSRVRDEAMRKATKIAERVASLEGVGEVDIDVLEEHLSAIVREEGSIQLIAVTNLEGKRIGQVYTQRGEKALFRNLLTKDFREKEWFREVLATGKPYYSDLFFSKYTGVLICTAALPLFGPDGVVSEVVDIDFKFDELAKLIDRLPDEAV